VELGGLMLWDLALKKYIFRWKGKSDKEIKVKKINI
jgi:hypothetical protein